MGKISLLDDAELHSGNIRHGQQRGIGIAGIVRQSNELLLSANYFLRLSVNSRSICPGIDSFRL